MPYRIFDYDPYLKPFAADIELRMNNYNIKKKELLPQGGKLLDFANGHLFYGFHRVEGGWVYREWAPAAECVYLMGDMNGWNKTSLPMTPVGNGNFELFLPGENALWGGCKVKAVVQHDNRLLERIPLYIRRVVQDPDNHSWCGEIVDEPAYVWHDADFVPQKELFIYECHIGMAQEEEKVGTYAEFRDKVLPRIKESGYNTLQIMAIMEHPYYGSFGYQVSNFFAASSRFGMPADLKSLVDTAHSMGIAVLLDVVHSHAVKNTSEGINEFDGTDYQFFHTGERGHHPAWDTKLFNYAKPEVIHFLLSNLKFWQTEYHFDGFRFDGVTSMIYHDHGLGTAFTGYEKYFSLNTETEAITYLQLANELIREVNPNAITIAEDMSAMPGMCLPIEDGGVGFDYRLSMGVPDMWIKLLKTQSDENWNMRYLWYELSGRRPHEKYIGYAESHDQALVGDKTIMFWLCDSAMYTHMSKLSDPSTVIDRGLALHKMIRLVTLSLAGEGYLNFMGNEFGHPEWIDFPREGNNWSSYYCRRQWHLADDHLLKYHYLHD
ncbi:MAG: 1,4-alpha-glucan-branching enzyme, partial [Clostridia bacterium]|nr:1,4-alpha-glucan-branching enzyme [Clostridia bacterium]